MKADYGWAGRCSYSGETANGCWRSIPPESSEPRKNPSLDKKSLEFRNNPVSNFVYQHAQTLRDFKSPYRSLVEKYRQSYLAVHVHFFGKMHRGTNSDMGCVIARGDDKLRLFPESTSELSFCSHDTQNRQQHPPMLIDVGEVVNELKCPAVPRVIRLQSLDLCESFWGNPLQSSSSDRVFKASALSQIGN